MNLIDYSLLAKAIEYYTVVGYQQVEVPWLVSPSACFATFPQGSVFHCNGRYFVGSAEQGFLDIDLPPGKYVACSPCFREDQIDALHQETFMKVELHQTDDTSEEALDDMIAYAYAFLSAQIGELRIAITNEGYDIETLAGIELGSYGRRTALGRTWLYGTGLALPRLTMAK